MSEPAIKNTAAAEDGAEAMSHEEMMSALFAHMVIQNTNMALMFLGKVPHPQSGEHMHDLEAARMFIDQLEMLEAKTKGNLTPEEGKLLQQSLMHLRMAFVETVEHPPKNEPAKSEAAPQTAEPRKVEPAPSAPTTGEGESHKRFSKKF
jgi:hypothetical protein